MTVASLIAAFVAQDILECPRLILFFFFGGRASEEPLILERYHFEDGVAFSQL